LIAVADQAKLKWEPYQKKLDDNGVTKALIDTSDKIKVGATVVAGLTVSAAQKVN